MTFTPEQLEIARRAGLEPPPENLRVRQPHTPQPAPTAWEVQLQRDLADARGRADIWKFLAIFFFIWMVISSYEAIHDRAATQAGVEAQP